MCIHPSILSCMEMNKPTQKETSAPVTRFPLGPSAATNNDLLLINPSKQLSTTVWEKLNR